VEKEKRTPWKNQGIGNRKHEPNVTNFEGVNRSNLNGVAPMVKKGLYPTLRRQFAGHLTILNLVTSKVNLSSGAKKSKGEEGVKTMGMDDQPSGRRDIDCSLCGKA